MVRFQISRRYMLYAHNEKVISDYIICLFFFYNTNRVAAITRKIFGLWRYKDKFNMKMSLMIKFGILNADFIGLNGNNESRYQKLYLVRNGKLTAFKWK
jgi:hypothetical protein